MPVENYIAKHYFPSSLLKDQKIKGALVYDAITSHKMPARKLLHIDDAGQRVPFELKILRA